MGRKSKIEPICSRFYQVVLVYRPMNPLPYTPKAGDTEIINVIGGWFVRNRETCADTAISTDLDEYRQLKRIWRRKKDDFDSACRFMDYNNLFSAAGVTL